MWHLASFFTGVTRATASRRRIGLDGISREVAVLFRIAQMTGPPGVSTFDQTGRSRAG
jgi:hypothetical protein